MRPERRIAALVIDDNDIDRANIIDTLTLGGYIAHGLPSPIGATKAARTLNVDVVLIDQNLPAMNGNKLASLFRGNPALRDLCVVLVSGNSDNDAMRELAKKAQVDGFLTKRDVQHGLMPLLRRLLAARPPRET